LFDSLAKEGLERLDDTGVPFDPTTHDAVEHETGDQTASRDAGDPAAADEAGAGEPVPAADGAREGASPAEGLSASEPVVVAVLRAGYRWKGRVIRPPMVRVRG
jgi:molecular chaperone GrpE (heat shock protein)